MIRAVHSLIYADDAQAARAFLRDVVGWPCVDAGGGWLIFGTGPSELGVHPASGGEGGDVAGEAAGDHRQRPTPQHHEISLLCDDLAGTMADLEAKGAVFTGGVREAGFGRLVMLRIPGAGEIMLYEPRHPTAYDR